MPPKKVHYQCKIVGTKAIFTEKDRPHDAILLVGDEKFYVIKQVVSGYLVQVLQRDSAEKDKKEFELKDVNDKEFTELMRIIHLCLMTTIRDSNVLYLLKLAAHFEMPSVIAMCDTYLSNFENAPDVSLMQLLELADMHKMSQLQVAVLKSLHDMNLAERQTFFDKYLDRIKNLSHATLKHLTRF